MVLDPTLSRDAPPSSGLKGALTTGPFLSPSPRQVIPKLTLHSTPPTPLSPGLPSAECYRTIQPQMAPGLARRPQLPSVKLPSPPHPLQHCRNSWC